MTLSKTPLVLRRQERYGNQAWRVRTSARLIGLWLSGRVRRRRRGVLRHQPARGRAKRQRSVSSSERKMLSPRRAWDSRAASAREP